jgi:hypothetical protein
VSISFYKELLYLLAFTLFCYAASEGLKTFYDCASNPFYHFSFFYFFLILGGYIFGAFAIFGKNRDEKNFTGYLLLSLTAKLLFSLTVITTFVFSNPEFKICLSLTFCALYLFYTAYFVHFTLRFIKP